jgi:hypothetical protein
MTIGQCTAPTAATRLLFASLNQPLITPIEKAARRRPKSDIMEPDEAPVYDLSRSRLVASPLTVGVVAVRLLRLLLRGQ